jgi:hypothetical protein
LETQRYGQYEYKDFKQKETLLYPKFLRLKHDNLLSSHCPGSISQFYLTTQILITSFCVGKLPHLGRYTILLVHRAITGTRGLTKEVTIVKEGRREAQRNVACYYRTDDKLHFSNVLS